MQWVRQLWGSARRQELYIGIVAAPNGDFVRGRGFGGILGIWGMGETATADGNTFLIHGGTRRRAEEGREGRVGVSDWGRVSVWKGLGAHKGRPYRGRGGAYMQRGNDMGGRDWRRFEADSGN